MSVCSANVGNTRSKLKKMMGNDGKVKDNWGQYKCVSFCHFLRAKAEDIQELQNYFRFVLF